MAISEMSAALIAVLPVFLIFFWLWMFKWRWRHHVWADIELREGETKIRRYRPTKDGILDTEWGMFATDPNAFSLLKGRPKFRYKQGGGPFAIRYDLHRSVDKRGTIIEMTNAFPVVIPERTFASFMKQHLFQDAYGNRFGMILILLLAIGFVGLLVVGLYMRG